MPRVLLIQVRQPGSFSERHEQECIKRRLGRVDVVPLNVFSTDPKADWYERAVGCRAFIIGGSGSVSVHDDEVGVWRGAMGKFFDSALEGDLAGFCICFGHQLLAQHLGADVVTDVSRREAGTVDVNVVGEDPLFASRAPRFAAHAGHSDHVTAAPKGTSLLAGNEASPIQAFRVDGTRTYATQFHPDFTAAEAKDRYADIFGTDGDAQAAMARFDTARDGDTERLLRDWFERI